MTDDATKTKAGGSPRLSEELGPLPERWYVVDRNGLATVCADEADARLQELQSRALYHRHAPYRAVRLVDAITVDALRAALASMTEDRDSWARQAADREQDALDLVAAERERIFGHIRSAMGHAEAGYDDVAWRLLASLVGPNVRAKGPATARATGD